MKGFDRRHRRLLASAALSLTALSGLGSRALAQATTPASNDAHATVRPPGFADPRRNILEEVVVTASRKRKEDVQHTPVAVTALSAVVLERNHVTSFDQIGQLAPNLQIIKSVGSAGLANVYLRGFGDYSNDPAVDPRVAVFLDGIYQPSSEGSLFDTFDVDQIEVDAGPQGTLLGKNAPIGAIYVTSARPTSTFGGSVQAEYGSYDRFGVRAKINIPIIKDKVGQTILTTRFSVSEKGGGNWVYNDWNHKRDFGGENTQAYRAAFAFTPSPEFEWDVNALYSHDNSPQGDRYNASYLGGFPGTPGQALQISPYPCLFLGAAACPKMPYGTENASFTSRPVSDQENVASNMRYSFDPVTVTLVSGYTGFWLKDNSDDAGTPYVALNAYADRTRYDEESAELRVSSNKGHGADLGGFIDWVAGAYFSHYDYSFNNHLGIGVAAGFQLPVGVANVNQYQDGTTDSEALFTHVIFNFTKQISGTFGVRYSWDQKTHDALLPGATSYGFDPPASFKNASFEGGLSYQYDPRRLLFVRFAQGYEAGGFAGFALGNTYQPELNNEYEIGVKTDWLDRRLRVNVDLFRNELSQLQVASAQAIPTPPGFLQETLNAGSAIVQGVETQIVAVPIPRLTAHLNLGYLDTHFSQNFSTTCSSTGFAADCSGLNFALAPKYTLDFGADYVLDLPRELGTVTLSSDFSFKSSLYTSDPVYPSSYQKGYGLLQAGVTFRDASERYSLEVYGTNILNRHYILAYTDPGGLAGWNEQGRPAEWGLRLTGKF